MAAPVPPAALWLARATAVVVFVLVIVVRGGPISAQNDALAVTLPTTAVSHGAWRSAEAQTLVPDPPGYPLLAAPLVALFRPWIGSPVWCSDRQVPATVARGSEAAFFRALLRPCDAQRPGQGRALPPWYRSQAVLGVGAWVVALVGLQLLLRAVHRRPTWGEAVGALSLALLPAASDALVQSFHPQDLLAVGFTLVALAQALRRRWVAVGVAVGIGVLCKQFAVLAVPGLLLAAPTWRARAQLAGTLAALCVAAVTPFWLADPVATWHALSGTYVEGAGITRSATAVGLLDIAESHKLEIARDAPLVAAVVLSLGVFSRARRRIGKPVPLVGLALACMATRMVFEVSVYQYYLLAIGVFLLALELTRGRPPLWTMLWVVVTRLGVLELPSSVSPRWLAAAFMVAWLLPLAFGLRYAVTAARPSSGTPALAGAQLLVEHST